MADPRAKTRMLTDEQRSALRFVEVSEPELDLECFPDFLVIGPQRTGSTWLHRNLARHPQVFMTDPKEIYYFSAVEYPDYHPARLPAVSTELAWYLDFFRYTEPVLRAREKQCMEDFGEPFDPIVRGEASATYAVTCSEAVLDDLMILAPDIKAIMLVRHPAERAWSHIKKDLNMDEGQPVEDITLENCKSFLALPYEQACSRYSAIIAKWSKKLRDGNLFVGDFRDVYRDPAGLLRRIYAFLGVADDARYVGDLASEQICFTQPNPIPAELVPILDEVYADEVAKLEELGFVWD